MDEDRVTPTLLGTACGDALGLAAEGMDAKAITRCFGWVDRFHLQARMGFVSDDTAQGAQQAQSLARHPGDLDAAARFDACCWGGLCGSPPGIGMATMRAWSDRFAEVTHTGPRAVQSARFVAEVAALAEDRARAAGRGQPVG